MEVTVNNQLQMQRSELIETVSFNKSHLKGVVYKGKNVVIQHTQIGIKSKRCYIIGNGNSLSVDRNNRIYSHDPGMFEFSAQLSKDHDVYAFYFTFEADGLEEAGKEVADFVNNLQKDYDEIVLVGHSKSGLCLIHTTLYCKKEVYLVTISSPFMGTVMADQENTRKILKHRIFIMVYDKIFSNHNVDKDIMPNSKFIQNLPKPKCKKHIDVNASLSWFSDCQTPIDLLLLFLNQYMAINGDGVVPFTSQTANSSKRCFLIFCSHAASLDEGLKLVDNCTTL